ncbi:CBM35 domain-containing protein [Streptomyces sp. NPDC101118]|uniref:CBM35 domain-containing protein n=1 Tax=Streptomyces sp. NPDC101118 TaxID=3366109 RepID=UPI003804CC93
MTPANNGPNNGANTPEDDDPFGYLYADGQAAGATPPSQGGGYGYPGPAGGAQPGVPRTSYNQVRTVGERRGPRQVPQQQPQPHYSAPETLQAGYGVPQQNGYGQQPPQHYAPEPARRGSSRRGLLIAAVAVVGAVVIGIGVALITDNKGKDKGDKAGPSDKVSQAPATPGPSKSDDGDSDSDDTGTLPKADAASGTGLALAGGATPQNTVPGARSADGKYLGGFNAVGSSFTWTVDVKDEGKYKLRLLYAVPGTDANATLTINGTPESRPINMKNWSNAPAGAWDKGWTNTYSVITLNKGTNTIKVSCEQGNSCDAIIDQVVLEQG